MAYTRVNWQDLPSTATPRNATNLNKMDEGIKEHDDMLLGNKAMGNIVVDGVRGKNLYSITSAKGYTYSSGLPSNATSLMVVDSYDLNNVTFHATDNNYFLVLLPTVQLEPNTQYTLSYTRTNTLVAGVARRWIYNVSDNGVYSVNNALNIGDSGDMKYTFTTNAVGKIAIAFGYNNSSSGNSSIINNLQIEKGSEATNFTPFKSFDATAYKLWENPDASASFASQSITLSDDIYNYKYYEVLFCYNTSTTTSVFSTGKIPVGMQSGIFISTQYNYRRYVNFSSSGFTIADCVYYATYGNSTTTTANTYLIPYQLIAYK